MAKKNIIDLAREETNYTRTENNALAHQSTLNSVLDFFSMGGALRERDEGDIWNLFKKAYQEDPLLSLKCLFYLRDIRKGQGERRTFRTILKNLACEYPESIKANFPSIVEFGRWDDFYAFMFTPCEPAAFDFMRGQFVTDLNSEHPSLLAKWLQSNNKKSSDSHQLRYKHTLKYFNMRADQYRKACSKLRARINLVESQMCAKQWPKINYEQVPSQASRRYAKAFKKNDESRYVAYLEDVKNGKKDMKANAIFPYEILRSAIKDPSSVTTFDLQWKKMPNWIGEENSIVVADTSGSMDLNDQLPILCAVSLAMYCAERNKGIFKDKFITFSSQPVIQSLVGKNILEKWNRLDRRGWTQNTDLMAVFNLLLMTAVRNRLTQADMPTKIYIVSDMEFDIANAKEVLAPRSSFFGSYPQMVPMKPEDEKTIFKAAQEMYQKQGFQLPKIIFWNVNARHDMAPVTQDECGVYLVSGCSPTIFKALMETKTITPIDLMLEVLNSPRYQNIRVDNYTGKRVREDFEYYATGKVGWNKDPHYFPKESEFEDK